jgi:restriction endonuclease S subunit
MTLYPFSQIAANITVRVEPSDTDLERYVGLEHLDPESLKLRRWGSPSDVIGQKLKFWKGDIIYGKRRAYQRKLAVADFDGICSAHAMVLRAKPEVCLPEFLPFFLQSDLFHNRALEISVGSLSPTINWTTLAKQEFPLPPVDEQRRIANLLWAADDVQVSYTNTAEAAKKLMIRSCIDWTDKPEWKKFSMQECSDNLDNLRVPLNQEVRAGKQGNIPYFGATGIIDYIDDFIFDEEIVLLGEDGDHFYKWQDWKQSQLVSGKSWVNNHAHVFKAKPSICTNRWLYRHFQHRNLTGLIQDSASMTRRKLTKAMLLNIKIPIPTLSEQEVITDKINEIEKVYEQLLEHLEACKNLKKEILNHHLG